MRIQTRGNSTNVWLSSGEGVINGSMSLSAPTLEKILQAVNEKYGTSLEGWTQMPTSYEVGDTVPNWNAYEKIEMQVVSYYKYDVSNGMQQAFVAMEVVNGTVRVYCANIDDSDNLIGYNGSGQWISTSIHKTVLDNIAAIAQQEFDNYNGIERIVKGQENITNWSDYSLLA